MTTKHKASNATRHVKPAKGSTARPGVIASIVEMIGKPAGATRAELVAALTKLFPDRRPEAMAITVGIQANKNAVRKTKDEDGAVRYFGGKKGAR